MGTLTQQEREARQQTMARFGAWLKTKEKSQRWGAEKLGVYHGYLNNLITGKNTAGEETCIKAQRMMQTTKKRPKEPSTSRGRKPAVWSAVTWDEIERFRVAHNLTNTRMAALCEVTNSTLHNWRRGMCAPTRSAQERIRGLLDGTSGQVRHQAASALNDVQLSAIRTVVCAYIESNPGMTPDTLVDVVGAVAGCFRS